MTAQTAATQKLLPRPLIRIFWTLHRAAHRISGGRFGLSQPAAGERFGMMRLTTIGRRSGSRRSTILGYYPDGANLVTLAMNGWADADPAWWLNLQAHPETTVDLPEGPRAVRARAATGAERDRLWARFRDYPGWGEDIDALAGRRSRETAVVVFEPQGIVDRGERSFSVVSEASEADRPMVQAAAPTPGSARRLKARHLWLIPGLAIAVYANSVSSQHGLGLVPVLMFGILPHLSVLVGLGQPHARGQLAPRAVSLFNAMHHPTVPLALAAVATTSLLSPFWFVGAVAWLSHIVIDWALGEGLRMQDGFVRSGMDRLIGVKLASPQPVRVTE
jgi:deazaflavin-dependent oxidoreductase (nitroreductase family)